MIANERVTRLCFFFFQAEDGIRDLTVTGVQTCALPISYHSLSIEGYSVTPALVERVRQGGWDPEHDAGDRRNHDALAARGYWQAFQLVKNEVEKVIAGENPAALARAMHNDWYRELFQPSVTAGLVEAGEIGRASCRERV